MWWSSCWAATLYCVGIDSIPGSGNSDPAFCATWAETDGIGVGTDR